MSKDPVQCFITITTGASGHGKSKRTIEELEMYVLNDIKAGRKGRPVLIFDTNNEFSKFKTVRYNVEDPNDNGIYLAQFKQPEIRRIKPFTAKGTPMSFAQKEKTVKDIMTYFRNGCVLLEDINTYMANFNDPEFISFLCNNRHRGLDLIIQFQSPSKIATTMWENITILRMHYQTDDFYRIRDRVPNFEILKMAQNMINIEKQKNNKYFFLYVNVRENKISGASKELFVNGCMQYVNEYMMREVKQMMSSYKMDRAGAIKSIIKKKMQLYFQ
jgi:hypothetical protein